MRIIGLMLTWNNLEFLRCALGQALGFCDELILVEGCHSQRYPKHSSDGTCAYIETVKTHPKLRIADFDYKGRYDHTQRYIREECPKMSRYYELGNWVFQWDDDFFFMEEDLPKLRTAIETTKCDSVGYSHRNFIYNFRFNSIGKTSPNIYRIVGGMRLSGISNIHYKNGKGFTYHYIDEMTPFHYSYVKKLERLKARFVMSIEKGTKASIGRYEQWMSVKWDKDEDIFKNRATIENIKPGQVLNVYNGEHPKAVADHPWRYIKDVREIK